MFKLDDLKLDDPSLEENTDSPSSNAEDATFLIFTSRFLLLFLSLDLIKF